MHWLGFSQGKNVYRVGCGLAAHDEHLLRHHHLWPALQIMSDQVRRTKVQSMQGWSVHHVSLKEDAAVAAELQRAASKNVVRERDALIPAVAHLD